jgi:hypothetical protein
MPCKASFLDPRRVSLAVGLLCTCLSVDRAFGQGLTAAELSGTAVAASTVTAQTVRSAKGVTSHQVTYILTLQMAPEEKLKHSLTIRTAKLDGTPLARNWKNDAVLGKPFAFRDGHAVWILEDNALVFLATLTEGGYKITITFEGSGSTRTCKIAWAIAKEVGVGKVTGAQTASGHKIDVLKQTPVSSACKVGPAGTVAVPKLAVPPPRPNAVAYSMRVWPGPSLPIGQEVSQDTPHGRLTCKVIVAGSRSCSWR